MKKTLVIVLTLALVLSACLLTLTACSGKEYEGSYSYAAWDYAKWSPSTTQKYGCTVKVTIQGDVITKVVVAEDTDTFYNVSAGWTAAYGSEHGYDSEGKTNWRLHGQEMADSFVGLTTAEVLKIKTYVSQYNITEGDVIPAGQPVTTGGVETVKYLPTQVKAVIGQYGDFGYTAGATQSSARLVLAIQDAILKSQGKTENPNCVKYDVGRIVTGEYKYANPWDKTKFYGVQVKVIVKNNAIESVEITSENTADYTNLSATWTSKENWTNNEAAFLASFKGMKVDAVKAIKVVCKDNGEPDTTKEKDNTTAAGGATISEIPDGLMVPVGTGTAEAPKLNGATQSAGRVILAVQNALSKLAD